MQALFCGIDIGTTNIKAVLVDADGRTHATKTRPTPRTRDETGPVTNASALVAAVEALIFATWRASGAIRPIVAISSAGVGEDGLTVAPGTLAPTSVSIPWFDRRAAAEAEDLQQRLPSSTLTGIVFEPTRTAAKWLWLARHSENDAGLWLALTDYPLAVWSGRPFMSETLAARTACYDVTARAWIPELLAAARAPDLPPVLAAGAVIGAMQAGPLTQSGACSTETMLVAGGHDHPVAASFIRRLDRDAIVDSLGTAELIYAEASHYAPRPGTSLVHSVPITAAAGQSISYVFEFGEAMRVLGPAPDWQAALGRISTADFASDPPWLPSRSALAALAHTDGGAGNGAMLSHLPALLEGCAFVTRSVIDEMLHAGVKESPVYSSGGWSRSDPLMRWRATLLGRPLFRIDESEQAGVGAALLARDSVGSGGDKAMPHARVDRFDPDPSAAAFHTERFSFVQADLTSLRALRH
ncbi:xylulokinase [Kaistia soli DSM 19436]|uniref:Xylulokinase n=1 Tax=Kaistia soli DSM 19436 TaxID=1122133 RepID=A0A1M5I837_9HYPH|nr:FGGY family carbohydrate kinase [Kaistia soli]SHG24279.1 xylulokinase [Kaistia soli DSM 19436]